MSSYRVVSISLAFVCVFACSISTAGTIFTADLTGDQEVPPVVTDASGTARLELSDDQSTLTYMIDTFGLDIGGIKTPDDPASDIEGVHIHLAPAGENGPVVFGIFRPQHDVDDRLITINGSSGLIRFSGIWDAADVANGAAPLADQLANLLNGDLYINVHTVANPGGEIRGQIVPVPEPSSLALIGVALAMLTLVSKGRLVMS